MNNDILVHVIKCANCQTRPATEIWCDSGVIGYIHGMGQNWCKRCVIEEQLKHAEKMASQIPILKAELLMLS